MTLKTPPVPHQGKSNSSYGSKTLHTVMIVLGFISLFAVVHPGIRLAQKISTSFIFAQILAFPIILGIGILMCSVTLVILYKAKSGGLLATVSCVVWSVVALAFVIFPYGPPRQRLITVDDAPQRVLSVVTFNTASTLTPNGFQELVHTFRPDVIILPETSAVEANQAIKASSYAGTAFETPNEGFTSTYNGSIAPTTVIVSKRLGAAKPTVGPATSFGTVAIEFEQPGLPTIIGIHAAPPLPGLMHAWKGDLERVVNFGESSTKPLLIAGDFNATLRHGALATRSRLTDTQELCSAWHIGTWNSQSPAILQTPIDHILLTPDYQASSCQTIRIGHSDHLAFHANIAIP